MAQNVQIAGVENCTDSHVGHQWREHVLRRQHTGGSPPEPKHDILQLRRRRSGSLLELSLSLEVDVARKGKVVDPHAEEGLCRSAKVKGDGLGGEGAHAGCRGGGSGIAAGVVVQRLHTRRQDGQDARVDWRSWQPRAVAAEVVNRGHNPT
ncbi:hypothetical protein PgNI_05879 [Pyricularia grisea]|uniref:Uncharacterized protein n=1 Tax=Pyricularia grisea TaxID=148305 RepID=A0A6P8B5Z9_PYRGI|nr:hypothetical protein PgNI_05879 [Pyricularia grisea]TLD10732.1 hypothetical protein PgNI_05879 [Pyricularia grisea]